MAKKAVSVTLETDNLLWLEGRTRAWGRRSLSETLDRLITEARGSARFPAGKIPSVAGTIEINPSDPDLSKADSYVRALYEESLSRPMLVRETGPSPTVTPQKARKPKSRRG
ncbi:MAG: hypothetical protein HY654_07120 [Acidobacteria bacterium]|nr:hypothetical protein [Acidobacteriota bacterium]